MQSSPLGKNRAIALTDLQLDFSLLPTKLLIDTDITMDSPPPISAISTYITLKDLDLGELLPPKSNVKLDDLMLDFHQTGAISTLR